jgi:hypothetical protein
MKETDNINNDDSNYTTKLPEYRKAKHELWTFLTINDIKALISCFPEQNHGLTDSSTEFESFRRLATIQFNLNTNKDKQRNDIIIDKYYYLVKFALANNFSIEQISALVTIQKRTHELAIDTSFGNLDETFDYFKNLLLVYSVHRPPFSLNIFTARQAKLIIDYFFDTYFKQFKFYKYTFSKASRLCLKFNYTNQIEQEDSIKNVPTSNDQQTDLPDIIIETVENETLNVKQEENDKLKNFIRDYLGQQIDQMKTELSNEITPNSKNSAKGKNAPADKPKSRNSVKGKK